MDSNQSSPVISRGQRIEFELPEGANLPENPDPTKDINLVCSFRVKPDGKTICMTKWGDTALPGYDGKGDEKTETKPDYSSMVPTEDAGGMGGQGGGGVGMSSMAGY